VPGVPRVPGGQITRYFGYHSCAAPAALRVARHAATAAPGAGALDAGFGRGALTVTVTRVHVNGRTLLLVFLRKCDHTVSYHLYIVNRYLWVLVPHTIRICL